MGTDPVDLGAVLQGITSTLERTRGGEQVVNILGRMFDLAIGQDFVRRYGADAARLQLEVLRSGGVKGAVDVVVNKAGREFVEVGRGSLVGLESKIRQVESISERGAKSIVLYNPKLRLPGPGETIEYVQLTLKEAKEIFARNLSTDAELWGTLQKLGRTQAAEISAEAFTRGGRYLAEALVKVKGGKVLAEGVLEWAGRGFKKGFKLGLKMSPLVAAETILWEIGTPTRLEAAETSPEYFQQIRDANAENLRQRTFDFGTFKLEFASTETHIEQDYNAKGESVLYQAIDLILSSEAESKRVQVRYNPTTIRSFPQITPSDALFYRDRIDRQNEKLGHTIIRLDQND